MTTLGGLVHVFNIIETQRLKKFTAYKIQMISFPKNESLFQSLTKLTVTKRYSDFKTLERNLLGTYKGYNFKAFFKADTNYFNRFDPEVVEQRKGTILEYLYYCAEHPILYRSQYFVKFFDDTSVNSILCDNLKEASPEKTIDEEEIERVDGSVELNNEHSQINDDYFLCGYLYDAALNFSHAVQEEANLRFKNAFDLYKLGIDKLLTGAKNDTNEMRKRIAKTKASKYLEKAEQLYENYILEQQENEFLIEDVEQKETKSIVTLERPISHMSRYKVIQVNGRIMKVQDRTDKKIYILKVIWKSHSHKAIFMPQNIPFMCSLLSYFHSENAIFLLLPFISGGLLWDYLKGYSVTSSSHQNLDEIFIEPPVLNKKSTPLNCENNSECTQLDLNINNNTESNDEIVENDMIFYNSDAIESNEYFTPSFEALNPDIDLDDLVKCSQQLLKSVTKTLEKSVILSSTSSDKEADEDSNLLEKKLHRENEEAIADDSHQKLSVDSPTSVDRKDHAVDLPEIILKRWASEIIICVNHLHKCGIILGDFNLDNILLGPNCHIILTYFYQNCRNTYHQLCELNRTAIKSHYVAFEFPLSRTSDYYSIGVVLYEIFTRNRFFTYHPGGISKFNEIQYNESCQLSEEAKDLIDVLIFKKFDLDSPFELLRAHPFFENIDFNEIEKFGYE